jgi:hypothetical protein
MFNQILDTHSNDLVMFLEMMDEQVEILENEYKNLAFEIVENFNF